MVASTTTYIANFSPVPQTGSLKVTVTPTNAVGSGAEWQVDGGAWQTSGTTLFGLSVGNHTVVFTNLIGWMTPADESVTIIWNQTITTNGTYTLPGQTHPADTNGASRITINEVTAYGAAWQQGSNWPIPPNPIPINYVTRAGYLWRNGECYSYDASSSPPLCWVSTPCPKPGLVPDGEGTKAPPISRDGVAQRGRRFGCHQNGQQRVGVSPNFARPRGERLRRRRGAAGQA